VKFYCSFRYEDVQENRVALDFPASSLAALKGLVDPKFDVLGPVTVVVRHFWIQKDGLYP